MARGNILNKTRDMAKGLMGMRTKAVPEIVGNDAPAGTREHAVARSLPDKPVVLIQPARKWFAFDFAAIWEYRELFYFLMWRDVKVRYKQTVLGVAWAVLQPLVTMLIFTYVLGKLARVPADGLPYPIFFYSGLVIWTFFANALTNCAGSLVGNTNLITKVYFPRLIIPAATVGAGLLDLAIAAVLLIVLLFYYRFPLTGKTLLVLPLMLLVTLFALGVGVLFAALNVRYRDVRYALPFLINIWMFMSPIMYPSSLVPAEWRWVLGLNPLAGIVEAFRAALFGTPVDWAALGLGTGVTVAMLVLGAVVFQRMERRFAEHI